MANLNNTWQDVDQAVEDVQNAQPIPAEVLVPAGGTTGQVLAKASNADGDTAWADQTGGSGITQWYSRVVLNNPVDAMVELWDRPFADWTIANIVAKTDVGSVTIDIQVCNPDGSSCASLLAAPVTVANVEQAITLQYNGVTAGKRLQVVVVGAPVDSPTQVIVDAGGTYETGTPPPSDRIYILNLDMETPPAWDDILGTEDCTFAVDDVYCSQYDGEFHGGLYSCGVQGIYSNVHLVKNFDAEVSEFYLDFWMWSERIGPFVMRVMNTAGDTSVVRLYYVDGVIKIYSDLFTQLETTFTPNYGVWVHYRLYFKYGATDGIIRLWHSETVDDFDGVAPDFEFLNVAMSSDVPAGAIQIRGYGSGAATSYLKLVDDILVWEPDGNE